MPRYDDHYPFWCPVCDASLEIRRFDGACRCWHCGRALQAVHDCGDDDCYDYLEETDEL